MTDTTDYVDSPASGAAAGTEPAGTARRPALSTLRLPQLQALATELGLPGAAAMRKSELLDVIRATQGTGRNGRRTAPAARRSAESDAAPAPVEAAPSSDPSTAAPVEAAPARDDAPRREQAPAVEAPAARAEQPPAPSAAEPSPNHDEIRRVRAELDRALAERSDRGARHERQNGDRPAREGQGRDAQGRDAQARDAQGRDAQGQARTGVQRDGADGTERQDRTDRAARRDGRPVREAGPDARPDGAQRAARAEGLVPSAGGAPSSGPQDAGFDDDDERGGRRGRRGRYRDRERTKRRPGRGDLPGLGDEQVEVSDDDVLLPVAGILDVLDSYAFIRTSGYLSGPNDVYVSLGQVRKAGLRPGDAVTGAVRQQREGEQPQGPRQQKFNALVRLDTVNGASADEARKRPEFSKLTPLYPQERLRLETEPSIVGTRIVDLVAPIGKGQRGLIVSPPKAGKTLMMQAIANAISINNPEVHLMVVLVDERPEEVTDMQRSVKGEVIASTFDRPASDHTAVAELAIERAKRLVELGNDVVVLLDSITRLGRAYNLAAPASGRILSGGVDSSALYPPKRFFGAARNIEHGGSLTIMATALIETGSKMDEVIFEEFKGTGNSEIVLDRKVADKRIFPALDVGKSGTRKEELLVDPAKLSKMWVLRRILMQMGTVDAMTFLLDKMKDAKSNDDFFASMNQ